MKINTIKTSMYQIFYNSKNKTGLILLRWPRNQRVEWDWWNDNNHNTVVINTMSLSRTNPSCTPTGLPRTPYPITLFICHVLWIQILGTRFYKVENILIKWWHILSHFYYLSHFFLICIFMSSKIYLVWMQGFFLVIFR